MFHLGVSLEAASSALDDPVQELPVAALAGTDDAELLALEVLG